MSVPPRSGRSIDERIYDCRRVKIPIMNKRKITTPQMHLTKVIGQA
jgi:hypothetical protein